MNHQLLRTSSIGKFVLLSMILIGCQNSMEAPDRGSYIQASEAPYCGSSQATAYSGSTTTVTGTATFQYRALDWTSGTCQGLCGDVRSLGIPYAEIRVLDAAQNTVQCGETDASGNFSLTVPRTAGNFLVRVHSRSYTNKLRVSVLEDIYSALPYTVDKSFSIASGQTSVSGVTLSASARTSDSVGGKAPGAAFNILANVYWANEFLRTQTGNASFVANKASIFWKAGFNPYSYFGYPDLLASFFVSSEDRLYILGGKNGDVKASDTDHFDDSVILHEYGHFLEAHYSHSDSPGGSHNGNFIIDPRLAWSEGFANYFQAAVLDNVVYATGTGPKGTSGYANYIDTLGFKSDPVEGSGSGAGILIKRSLTESAASAVYDRPATNEGIFREFSISRTLFKAQRASIPFQKVWESFTTLNNTAATTPPLNKFVNFGLFNAVLNSKLTDATQNSDWSAILTEEKQRKDLTLYANLLTQQNPGGGSPICATTTLAPVADASSRSNQLMSNDFFTFYHDGVSKKVGFVTSTTGVLDINLYLYSADYYYSEEIEEYQAGFANPSILRTSKSINISSNSETETVDMSGLPAGYYMVNVKASTYGKTSASLSNTAAYYLFIANGNTVTKCLTPSP